MWSDTHIISNPNKEIHDWDYKDWVEYFMEHGALRDLAECMAKSKMEELCEDSDRITCGNSLIAKASK